MNVPSAPAPRRPPDSSSSPAVDAVVIGAGIAGLAAAYELHRRGIGVLVLERASRPGGVILTEHEDGLTIDAGPDSMLVQKPAAIELCAELGLAGRLVATLEPRTAFVLRAGRLHPLPEGSVLGLPVRAASLIRSGLFSAGARVRMAAEPFVPARRTEEDESIGAFVERRFGREAVTYLADPLLAGIHAGDVDRLSVRALFPRLVEAERASGSVLRGLRRLGNGRAGGGLFRSLAGGLGELVSALEARLPRGALRCGTGVARVEKDEVFRVYPDGGAPIAARAVVAAAPAYVTGAIVRGLDSRLAGLCDDIRYASSATIVLAYPRDAVDHPLSGSGYVVPSVEKRSILAVSWISSKWPDRAPSRLALMRAFAGGARDPSAVDRDDGDLVAMADRELRERLSIGTGPAFARVYRWTKGNAQHEVGHLDRVAAIDGAVGRHPGLAVIGSGFRGVGLPDCIADARATAARVAEFLSRTP